MLVRGGYVGLTTGSLRDAGFVAYYWSSTTYPNATHAYHLDFGNTNVYPSYYYSRFLGFSVRYSMCLVRGGNIVLNLGSLRRAGLNSLYWSATAYSNATYAYALSFDSTSVGLSDYSNRFVGYSVC